MLGDAFALIALPLLVFELTNSVFQMGLLTSASGVSMLVMGLLAGVIVDRMDRRRLMIWCDICQVLVSGAVLLGWWTVRPQLWLLYIVTVLGSALGMLFQVAYTTTIPNLIDHDQLTEANSRLHITFALGTAIGPFLGPSALVILLVFCWIQSIRKRPHGVSSRRGDFDDGRCGIREHFNDVILITNHIVLEGRIRYRNHGFLFEFSAPAAPVMCWHLIHRVCIYT